MNPEPLINNPAVRGLIRVGGLAASRGLLRRLLAPVMLPAAKRRRLEARVRTYFQRYVPDPHQLSVEARVQSFFWHYGSKLAEDCITLGVPGVERFKAMIRRHVVVEGLEYFHQALDEDAGILAVGSHVGSPTFGTPALLSLFLTVPPERYRVVRFCAEPEAIRYPEVLRNVERVLQDYGGDLAFIFTQRESKSIATELSQRLAEHCLVTTNLDVLLGGASQQPFRLFDRAWVQLPAVVGAAKAACRTGAVVLPWVNLRTATGFRLVLSPPIGPVPRLDAAATEQHPTVAQLCAQLRGILEQWIVDQPEQWFYWDRFHRRHLRDEP